MSGDYSPDDYDDRAEQRMQDAADERMEAALARADHDYHYPEHFRGMAEPS
jgi:hypothetical protein